ARGDAPAILCGEERLSYREVNQRAEEIASQLRKAGAQRGEVVAFALPRGSQAICAMLAILKCGCAYLPLVPQLPKARVDDLLRIARPSVLLTMDGIRTPPPAPPRSGEGSKVTISPPLRFGEGVGGRGSEAAYVLFTSGSTGVPKAVCVPHRGVTRLVCG